jgi:hypothetical protein
MMFTFFFYDTVKFRVYFGNFCCFYIDGILLLPTQRNNSGHAAKCLLGFSSPLVCECLVGTSFKLNPFYDLIQIKSLHVSNT